jgi:hypothetical protein
MHREAVSVPQDPDSEKVVIAACMKDQANAALFVEDDFYSGRHRAIFRALNELIEKKIPVEPLAIHKQTEASNQEVAISDIIQIYDEYPFIADLSHYVRHIKNHSKRRRLQVGLEKFQKRIVDLSVEDSALDHDLAELVAIQRNGDHSKKNIKLPLLTDYAALDLKTEWAVENLIVAGLINALIGKSGLGKTSLMMQVASCVTEGENFLGLETKKMPVTYLDFENPLATLCDRARIYRRGEVRIWDLSNPVPPPRLDSKEWVSLKELPPGMLIIDTFRSSHSVKYTGTDERMVMLFQRLKELRGLGFTIVLLIHTTKADDATYKGPSDIPEQVDHIIALERVREIGSDKTDDDDSRVDLPLRLGFRMKTRFKPVPPIFLKFDPERGFYRAESPEDLALPIIGRILEDYCDEKGAFPNQTLFFEKVKESLQINPRQFRGLLEKGEGQFWKVERGCRNACIYHPCSKKLVFQGNKESAANQDKETSGFFSFSSPSKQTEKDGENQFFSFSTLSMRGEELKDSNQTDSDGLGYASEEDSEKEVPFT